MPFDLLLPAKTFVKCDDPSQCSYSLLSALKQKVVLINWICHDDAGVWITLELRLWSRFLSGEGLTFLHLMSAILTSHMKKPCANWMSCVPFIIMYRNFIEEMNEENRVKVPTVVRKQWNFQSLQTLELNIYCTFYTVLNESVMAAH